MSNKKRTTTLCVSALALTLAVSTAAFAQGMAKDKPVEGQSAGLSTRKVIAENEKLIVTDTVTRPGEGTAMESREGWVYYYVSGGKVERTYADGSKEVVPRKTGQVILNKEKRPYSTKNIGTTTVHIIVVHLK